MILNLAFSSISCCFYAAKIIFCFHIAKQFVFILCSLLCRLGVCFLVCGIGSFFVLCPALPVPLVRCKSTLCRTAGEGVRRMQSSRKNSKRKRHFVPFFLLPYGITAENQPFNDSLANDLLIDIKLIFCITE